MNYELSLLFLFKLQLFFQKDFLEPHEEYREKIFPAQIPDIVFTDTALSSVPMDRNNGIGKSMYDRLQRKLNRYIEILGNKRLHSFYHLDAIGLKRVGDVVIRDEK